MENTVYICCADMLYDDTLFDKVLENASDCRKNKALSLNNRKDQNLSLAATHILNYRLLQQGLCEKDMTYSKNEYEKPSFSGYENIFFNISHSESYALCTFSEHKTGCDIQKIKPVGSVAEKFLTEPERQYVLNYGKDEFFKLWALKESIAKCAGTGISLMRSFSVVEDMKIINRICIDGENLLFKDVAAPEGYFAAVCFSGGKIPENVINATF